MTTKLSEVLRTAADLIEKHGHVHGRFMEEDGHLCLNGAIQAASEGIADVKPFFEGGILNREGFDFSYRCGGMASGSLSYEAKSAFAQILQPDTSNAVETICDVNNRSTTEEAINLLREAAATLEKKHEPA